METVDKLAVEHAFSEYHSQYLSADALSRWEACRSGHRFQVNRGSEIIAYHWFMGEPIVLRRLKLDRVGIDLTFGLTSTWLDDETPPVQVGHTPVEVAEGCFLWHNKFTTVERIDRKGGWQTRFAMTWRTPLNPRFQEEGVTYLAERKSFEQILEDLQ